MRAAISAMLRVAQYAEGHSGTIIEIPLEIAPTDIIEDFVRRAIQDHCFDGTPHGTVEIRVVEVSGRLAPGCDECSGRSEDEDRLLDVNAASTLLNVPPRWVRDHQDELPRVAFPGRLIRFSEKRLRRFIERRVVSS